MSLGRSYDDVLLFVAGNFEHFFCGLLESSQERCGVVVRRADIEFVELRNCAPFPRTSFKLPEQALLEALSGDTALLAIVHSHPTGSVALSRADLDALAPRIGGARVALLPECLQVVLAPSYGSVQCGVHVFKDGEYRKMGEFVRLAD